MKDPLKIEILDFKDQWRNKPRWKICENDGTKKVDSVGHLTIKQQINSFKNAGKILMDSRAGKIGSFDADFDTDPSTIRRNPFRDRGLDFFDADRIAKSIAAGLKASEQEALKKLKDADQKAYDEALQTAIKNALAEGQNTGEKGTGEIAPNKPPA